MKLYYFLMVLLLSLTSYAQNLNGKVEDVFGNTIADVYIYNENSDVHTHTNEFGNFTLTKVTLYEIFKISKIGYKSINFKVEQLNEKVKIILEEVPDALLVPISINNSWKLVKWKYFPMPLGVKISIDVNTPVDPKGLSVNDAIDQVEAVVRNGISS